MQWHHQPVNTTYIEIMTATNLAVENMLLWIVISPPVRIIGGTLPEESKSADSCNLVENIK